VGLGAGVGRQRKARLTGIRSLDCPALAICYTVDAIPNVIYNVGTEVNLVVQTDIRTLLPKRISNNASHYTLHVLFCVCMARPRSVRGMTLRHWAIRSRHFETACVLNLMGRNVHQHGTWTFQPLKIKTLRCLRNVGIRLRSDRIAARALRNAQNTQCTT
jgi:hypothetical protein